VPGHWEGDLIKGAFNRSSVGTLVERKTRFVVLCKMNGNGAEAALESFSRQMKRLPAALRKSMTYDRGSEMVCHPELARRLKIDIWFCDPHAPWQRGSNENTNGLLRQFMPKGTDLGSVSQTWLNDVAALMNNRPRKTLGWRTPAEAMADEIAAFKSTVALEDSRMMRLPVGNLDHVDLRLDVGPLVVLQRGDLDLVVEVADVADDRHVLHLAHVLDA
jgi:IS30 family transposase